MYFLSIWLIFVLLGEGGALFCALLSLPVICYDRDTTSSTGMGVGGNGNSRCEYERMLIKLG